METACIVLKISTSLKKYSHITFDHSLWWNLASCWLPGLISRVSVRHFWTLGISTDLMLPPVILGNCTALPLTFRFFRSFLRSTSKPLQIPKALHRWLLSHNCFAQGFRKDLCRQRANQTCYRPLWRSACPWDSLGVCLSWISYAFPFSFTEPLIWDDIENLWKE